ncbi:hypothetical protein GOV11_01180 [Candidatus Woesearchaeota archaeon]|nr:hypothetical protein [Candidatus Woesearchaeota archaeon]
MSRSIQAEEEVTGEPKHITQTAYEDAFPEEKCARRYSAWSFFLFCFMHMETTILIPDEVPEERWRSVFFESGYWPRENIGTDIDGYQMWHITGPDENYNALMSSVQGMTR